MRVEPLYRSLNLFPAFSACSDGIKRASSSAVRLPLADDPQSVEHKQLAGTLCTCYFASGYYIQIRSTVSTGPCFIGAGLAAPSLQQLQRSRGLSFDENVPLQLSARKLSHCSLGGRSLSRSGSPLAAFAEVHGDLLATELASPWRFPPKAFGALLVLAALKFWTNGAWILGIGQGAAGIEVDEAIPRRAQLSAPGLRRLVLCWSRPGHRQAMPLHSHSS